MSWTFLWWAWILNEEMWPTGRPRQIGDECRIFAFTARQDDIIFLAAGTLHSLAHHGQTYRGKILFWGVLPSMASDNCTCIFRNSFLFGYCICVEISSRLRTVPEWLKSLIKVIRLMQFVKIGYFFVKPDKTSVISKDDISYTNFTFIGYLQSFLREKEFIYV